MVGLLGARSKLRGLLGQDPAPAVDPGAVLRERFGSTKDRQLLLSAMAPQPVPERNRVSGWRVLDGVLGGRTVSESLDGERDRETALAQQRMGPGPRMMAIAQTIEDPRELALLAALGPEGWGEAIAPQYTPQVVGAGAAQSIAGRRVLEQPSFTESGDTILSRSSEGVAPVFTRTTPSISEAIAGTTAETGRFNAETERLRGVTLSPGEVANRLDGTEYARGAPRVFSAPQGTDLVTDEGQAIYENAPAPRPPSPADDEDFAAIEGFDAANARFTAQLIAVGGDPQRGIPPAFDLSPASALRYKAALATGIGMTPEAAAYGNYVSEVESAVSDALRLNSGPQTDQDAAREARALLSNIDNRDYVLQRLPTVIANNQRLRDGRRRQIDRRQGAGGGQAPAQQAPVRVNSESEYRALRPGTQYVAPDGTVRTKQ